MNEPTLTEVLFTVAFTNGDGDMIRRPEIAGDLMLYHFLNEHPTRAQSVLGWIDYAWRIYEL